MILAAVAMIVGIRVRAGWYWCVIILGLPIVGPIAYFIMVRSPRFGSHAARRLQARRRLKTLQVQLGHWRGAGVLAEAGEELLVLGKNKEAEKHFLEAIENGASVEDSHFGLAQALQSQGRFADAVPYLEKLVAVEADSRLGEGPLALARCLDESGRCEEAEPVLRRILERRTMIEAQVRLARILQAKGEKDEAGRLVAELLADAEVLPRYLRQRHGAWLRAVRRLRPGTALPRPRVDGAITRSERLRVAFIAASTVLGIFLLGLHLAVTGYFTGQIRGATRMMEETEHLRARLDALDRTYRWTRGDDLERVELTAADLDRYLRVWHGLEPALRETARQESADRHTAERESGVRRVFTSASAMERWWESQTAFLRSFVARLEREEMGPRELANLIALVEWRFLRRPEALVFGLPEYQREDWASARLQLSRPAYLGESELSNRSERKRRAHLQAKVEALEKQARAAVGLSPASQAVLESRRAEIEALDPNALSRIAHELHEFLAIE
jgi:hypothetical protein